MFIVMGWSTFIDMNFRDLIVEYPEVLDKDLCDTIIDLFEESQHKIEGISSQGNGSNIKISTDLHISAIDDPKWADIDAKLYKLLEPVVLDWNTYLVENLGNIISGVVQDSGYQIQRTSVGGKYDWHTDDSNSAILDTARYSNSTDSLMAWYTRRYSTYIMYLNDQKNNFEGGRTQFKIGNGDIMSIEPKMGTVLMFPANALFTHRGEVVTSGNKYLITGWLSDCIECQAHESHELSQQLMS